MINGIVVEEKGNHNHKADHAGIITIKIKDDLKNLALEDMKSPAPAVIDRYLSELSGNVRTKWLPLIQKDRGKLTSHIYNVRKKSLLASREKVTNKNGIMIPGRRKTADAKMSNENPIEKPSRPFHSTRAKISHCYYCNKEFPTVTEMIEHLVVHIDKTDYFYKCVYKGCDHKPVTPKSLYSHILAHEKLIKVKEENTPLRDRNQTP